MNFTNDSRDRDTVVECELFSCIEGNIQLYVYIITHTNKNYLFIGDFEGPTDEELKKFFDEAGIVNFMANSNKSKGILTRNFFCAIENLLPNVMRVIFGKF